jgi:hypothetical protein
MKINLNDTQLRYSPDYGLGSRYYLNDTVFYVTVVPIAAGEELLINYGKAYVRNGYRHKPILANASYADGALFERHEVFVDACIARTKDGGAWFSGEDDASESESAGPSGESAAQVTPDVQHVLEDEEEETWWHDAPYLEGVSSLQRLRDAEHPDRLAINKLERWLSDHMNMRKYGWGSSVELPATFSQFVTGGYSPSKLGGRD